MPDIEENQDDETWNIIEDWELEMADRDMPVVSDWENRVLIYEYNIPDRSVSLLFRLGMPQVPTAAVSQPGMEFGSKFKNYRVELFGVRGQLRAGRRAAQPDGVFEIDEANFIAGGYGVWEQQLPNGVSWITFSIHIWRMRLFARNVTSYIEQSWQTARGRWYRRVTNMNCGHQADIGDDAANLKALAGGLQLFNLVLDAAKPRSLRQRAYTLEMFKRDAYQAIEQLARQPVRKGKQGKRRARRILAKEVLANKIGCGKQTLYDFINENEGLWDHFTTLFEILRNEPQTSLDEALNRL